MTGISGALATVAAGCGLAVVWGKKGLVNRGIQVIHIKAFLGLKILLFCITKPTFVNPKEGGRG